MQELVYRISNDIASMTIGEKFMGGILITVFSMIMVFAVLVLLMYVIKGLGVAFADNKPRTEVKEAKPVTENIEEKQAEIDETEAIAAIMAALNAMKSSENSKIVIRQIVKNQSSWADAGLIEQLNSRL